MTDSPMYRFNKNPQFSVNHMADYLACQNATQRTGIIRAAKFPSKRQVSTYSPVRHSLRDSLSKNDFGKDDLDFLAGKLDAQSRREKGQAKNNSKLCLKAVECFQDTFTKRAFSRYDITPSSSKLALKVNDVKINVTTDATVTQVVDEVTFSGGIILIYSFSADRGSIEEKQKLASGLLLWALEGGQLEPLPRLCMAVDLKLKKTIKASSSVERFRNRVFDSCLEIKARWGDVTPPANYDGEDWR